MTTFDKREEAFEKQFSLDEEHKFKAVARRNKLLGLWAAQQLGISGDTASEYAKSVVAADFDGDRDVLHKVLNDLNAKNIAVTEDELRSKMDEFFAQAVAQVKAAM